MSSEDNGPGAEVYDVAVIGGGVVGCAVARELSASVSVVIIEARCDIGDGTSKANTAILHTGFDATPGTLESRLVARGYTLLKEYAGRAGIAMEPTGAVLVAWTEEELAALPKLAEKAAANGYHRTRLLGAAEVIEFLPHLGPGVRGGLEVPDESIIDPWSTTLGFANDALARGARLLRECRVESVSREDGITTLHTSSSGPTSSGPTSSGPISPGAVRARFVVNAAGLGADVIDGHFGYQRFTVTPRRGELMVFDKLARPMAPRIVLPVPFSLGKGVLVSPTIFGNVMLGPTAEDLTDRSDTSTSEAGVAFLTEKGARIMPELLDEEVTAMYAGLRAATEHGDYVVELDADQGYLLLGGIRSTGLTSSLALAEHARELLTEAGLEVTPSSPEPAGTLPNLGEAGLRPHADADRVAGDAEYGRVVCFCERVTRGEIRDALQSAIPPRDLDGLRRRTRAVMGRCQGFYCGAEVQRLLEKHQTESNEPESVELGKGAPR